MRTAARAPQTTFPHQYCSCLARGNYSCVSVTDLHWELENLTSIVIFPEAPGHWVSQTALDHCSLQGAADLPCQSFNWEFSTTGSSYSHQDPFHTTLQRSRESGLCSVHGRAPNMSRALLVSTETGKCVLRETKLSSVAVSAGLPSSFKKSFSPWTIRCFPPEFFYPSR